MQITDRDYGQFSHSSHREGIGKSSLRNWLIKGCPFCGIETVSEAGSITCEKNGVDQVIGMNIQNLSRGTKMYNRQCLPACHKDRTRTY